MRRIKKEKAVSPEGFSRWIQPRMESYIMACCDCGLVHEMQFKALEVTKQYASGEFTAKRLPRTKYQVEFRARRAEGYTRARRAKKKRS